MSAVTMVAVTCAVIFALCAIVNTGTARSAYRCAVLMAACWALSTLGVVT
jgi:hypothetical protein